jgi:hypothetical protein
LNPPANPFKPLSAAATIRPSDLHNDVLVDDNAPPRLNPAKNKSRGFQSTLNQPLKRNLSETSKGSDDSDVSDSPPPSDANTHSNLSTIEVKDRDDEDSSDEEAATVAERHFTLSSPTRQTQNSDVICLSPLIEISDDFDI